MKSEPQNAIVAAPLSRQHGASLQHQVYLTLREAIVSGRLADGERLPSEEQLTQMFGVARVTIRKALALLAEEELLDKQQGRGSVVRHRRVSERIRVANVDLLDHVRMVGVTTTVRLLGAARVAPSAELQDFFQCKAGEVLQRVVRLRSGEFGPIFHVVTYLSPSVGVLKGSELKKKSLLGLLRDKGFNLARGRQIISATAADPSLANHLNTAVGAPLVYIRRFHRDDRGHAIQYIELHALPQYFEVEMTIGNSDTGPLTRNE